MRTIDRSRPLKRETVPAGTAIIAAGDTTLALTILHSGLAELVDPPADGVGQGRRVGLIKGESLCGISDLRDPGPAHRTVRAVTDCIVSSIPVTADDLARRLYEDAELNLRSLRGLVQRIESSIYLFRNYTYLWHKLALIADAVALAYDFGPQHFDLDPVDRLEGSLDRYSAYLRQRLAEEGIEAPGLWDANVLVGSIQERLRLFEAHDRITVEATLDHPQFLFVKRLLGRDESIVKPLLTNDEPGTVYLFQFLARSLEAMIARNVDLVDEIGRLLELLFREDGWIAAALAQHRGEERERRFSWYLAKACFRFYKDVLNLLDRRLTYDYPLYARLGELRREDDRQAAGAPREAHSADRDASRSNAAPTPAGAPAGATDTAAGVAAGRRLEKYRGLAAKLIGFSDLSQGEQHELEGALEAFKALPDRQADDPEARRIRERLIDGYWRLYESCFLKVINSDLKAFVPGVMLHLGLFDETLVDEDDLAAIDAAYAQSLYTDDTIPVMTLPYFLEKIYHGEVQPSFTELGESFAKRLKAQSRMTKREQAASYRYEDTPEDRVRYELREIAPAAAGIVFGARRRSLPFLCRETTGGNLGRLFVEPEDVAARIAGVRDRDYTLFHRDVGFRHRYGTDIVRKEVLPNVVLYPTVGSRMMMWQELDGSSRHTPGRFFLPVHFTERYDEALLETLASYRWELQKTIAGANWMDPVDGGLVGAYHDYITYYQKSPRLTSGAKARIKEQIARTRSDRDRFAADYVDWIRCEYEGKVRLNPVARDIFFRHCPFRREIREQMARKPLYADLEQKHENRLRKAIAQFQSRIRRFERADEPVPEELRHHLDVLQS